MKTLIAYGTKHGYTRDCVERLRGLLPGETTAVDLGKTAAPDLSGFDTVLVGGSIHVGKVQPEVAAFCRDHEAELAGRRLGLFLSSGMEEEFETNLRRNFPSGLVDRAVPAYFGGELRKDRLGFGARLLTAAIGKAMAKEGKSFAGPRPENVDGFAARFPQPEA